MNNHNLNIELNNISRSNNNSYDYQNNRNQMQHIQEQPQSRKPTNENKISQISANNKNTIPKNVELGIGKGNPINQNTQMTAQQKGNISGQQRPPNQQNSIPKSVSKDILNKPDYQSFQSQQPNLPINSSTKPLQLKKTYPHSLIQK